MNKYPSISICIPTYRRLGYLQKLLGSIAIQSFKDFEVIITDDTPDDSVGNLVKDFYTKFDIKYFKNVKTLGTPENWNESIRKSAGTWIKLMHDDDWLDNENSLQAFYRETVKKPGCSFFFSAYNNVYGDSTIKTSVRLKPFGHFLLSLSPLNLFKKQYVGNPSCTLIRRDIDLFYDSDFKWVVDFEYYIRCLQKLKAFHYIDKRLICVGQNPEQVTGMSYGVPEVEIPENHLLIHKMGIGILRNIFVYDYYWRLYRNLNITNEEAVRKYYPDTIDPHLLQMIDFQKKLPAGILRKGVFSKFFMSLNYFLSVLKKI